jgi:adenylosuccinate synthase
MPATVICGLQWGDEGKGKATDLLASGVSAVVRYQGGDNAGHTVVVGDEVFKLHLVPSGVLHKHITPIIGPGVVVNPRTLLTELDQLRGRGIATDKLRVSSAAHVIMPYHVALDAAREGAAASAGGGIGTTRRGIGPAYGDRAWRTGIRMGDLLEPDLLRERLAAALTEKNALLATYGADAFALDGLLREALDWGGQLAWAITDTTALVQHALAAGEHVLFEGAQGTLLDLDHGTYPYVTSSNPIAGGACTGGGIGPLQVDQVLGILKAYSTRVGSGPLPTELHDAVGDHLTEVGREYGTTTGRRRRSGWLDFVPLRYAVQVNSVSTIMLNKLDILSGLAELKVCTGYRVDGRLVDEWPLNVAQLERAEPVYESFPGWTEDISGCRSVDELPAAARRYVAAIEERAGAPINVISVGPERTQTLSVDAGRVTSARPGTGAAA